MIKNKIAVASLSGGMDSCVTAAIANQEYELALVHINYGQRTEKRELKAFNDIADFYGVEKRLIIDFTHFSKIGGSSLTDYNIEVSKANLQSKEIPTSYVPFRNANILSVCVSWAEVLKAEAVFIGVSSVDYSGYPDCRPEFIEAFQRVLEVG
ncbi:MAG: 7-cyano-7-deazaguanine synthase, partial [Melioribacter sp.]|nr:7-cyano-7-deazaguanine synthase [Melioribacter sp.]